MIFQVYLNFCLVSEIKSWWANIRKEYIKNYHEKNGKPTFYLTEYLDFLGICMEPDTDIGRCLNNLSQNVSQIREGIADLRKEIYDTYEYTSDEDY